MSEKLRPIYYDTETTGISPQNDRVVEIAMYDPVNQKEFVSFINPGRAIPAEATAIHHITNEMVADAPSWADLIPKMVDFCSGNSCLVAHNNDSFDVHFLQMEFRVAGVEMPQWKFLDTLKWARKYRKDLPRHSLQFLREIYGIAENNAHRALDDVVVLHQLFSKMIDDLPFEVAYDLMQKESARERIITHMPFGKHKGVLLAEVPKNYLKWLNESGALDKPENTDLKNKLNELGVLAQG